jgi:chromosome segregation ATPase
VIADAALAIVAELQARDDLVAARIGEVAALADRVRILLAGASEVQAGLAALPAELAALERGELDARDRERGARSELALAEGTLAGLERARRPKAHALEEARREVETAVVALADVRAYVERLAAQREALRETGSRLEREAGELERKAREAAAALARLPRLMDAGKSAPASGLDGLLEWGGRVRAALFVLRGTLEAERERIVAEASALGSAVLGEDVGVSSVWLVRRRLEQVSGHGKRESSGRRSKLPPSEQPGGSR